MILFQSEKASEKDRTAIPYAIDRTKDDLTLADITRFGNKFPVERFVLKDFS